MAQADDRNIHAEIMDILETSTISAELKNFHGHADAENSAPIM